MMARPATTLALIRRTMPIAAVLVSLAGGEAAADAQARGPDTAIVMPELVEAPMPPPVVSFSVTGASDYIFRGVSQTENGPAIFVGSKVSYDHFYIAAGGENVYFRNGIDAE